MTTAAPAPEDVLEKVDALGPPGTPVTTPEVAEGFDCTQRTIYNRLEALVDDDILKTKKVGANSRVWWRPVDGDVRRNGSASDRRDPVTLRDGQTLSVPSDSEMAERIREFEWAETPIGPIDEWPTELQVAVEVMLGASTPIGIYWGEDLTLLYNDPARDVIGEKHPDALGQPARDVFAEAWDTLGPIHEQVMAGDGATRLDQFLLPLERTDEIEDIWWDSSYSPIPLADGSIGGVFNIAIDVTERVQAEQELRESEERYHRLFDSLNESINEGFCIVEVLADESEASAEGSKRDGHDDRSESLGERDDAADWSESVEYRFVEANPAFEELTGLTDVVGERVGELNLDGEPPGFEVCEEVAQTGEPRRVETTAEPLNDCWYDVRVFPYG